MHQYLPNHFRIHKSKELFLSELFQNSPGISLRNTQKEAFSNPKEILYAVRAKICLQK